MQGDDAEGKNIVGNLCSSTSVEKHLLPYSLNNATFTVEKSKIIRIIKLKVVIDFIAAGV